MGEAGPRRALITGGSRGIGAGIATVFVRHGVDVIICGRDQQAGKAAAAAIDGSGSGRCRFIRCNVMRTWDNERLVSSSLEALGGLDCLVNNAGWHPPHRPIDAIPVDEFIDLFRVNVVSCFELAKLALPTLREVAGSVVNIGSLVGAFGQERAVDYVATKATLEGFTKALAIDEARHGVRVNLVLPGVIETQSHRQYLQRQAEPAAAAREVDQWQWLGRVGTPEEVGEVCYFVASRSARFMTGACLSVTGGAELGYGRKAGWVPPLVTSVRG